MNPHEYIPVPTFDYSSAFNYNSILGGDFETTENEYDYTDGNRRENRMSAWQTCVYHLLTVIAFLLFALTAPISAFFCVKKIDSLKRCLVHRLGNRLPLKGPGYVLTLPFIDHISIIDLVEERFDIVETEQGILTGDGSIISMRPCEASLSVTNAVLTTLKIDKLNVKQCLRLRFGNMIRSKHVEDLENKTDFIVKQFEENCNKFLQRWGYSLRLEQIPRFTVIERADPLNPIKSKLSKLLSPDEANNQPSSPAEALLNLIGGSLASPQVRGNNTNSCLAADLIVVDDHQNKKKLTRLTETELDSTIPVLQWFVDQYRSYVQAYDDNMIIELMISNDDDEKKKHQNNDIVLRGRHHFFRYLDGTIRDLMIAPDAAAQIKRRLLIRFASYFDFEHFLVTKDVKYVKYSFQ